jgi:aminopeptidase N
MHTDLHRTIYRKDYTASDYLIESVELRFELGEEVTRVSSRLAIRANYDMSMARKPLVLDGHRFVLRELFMDGRPLSSDCYTVAEETLTINDVPERFTLVVITEIRPQENTHLEGLYRSSGIFCTQCEAEGFRSITYYIDRPDVMALFTTTIIADKVRYPVLLSNGNIVEKGDLEGGRHFATWYDPFKKPCYLFAMVAGDLVSLDDCFVTGSGRPVALSIYVQEHNLGKCRHALDSLKNAMSWDEERFNREYDLDCYMVVAVDDFNMGAMENKGLNIFNSRYVLATPETATDEDYRVIEEVVGHEYFHNWTGNRITCRDWFQLSIKEGLTIFRDQEFSSDMGSRGVKRVEDVRYLRTIQFAEDGGPLSHPVRPDSYMEINNFYTTTVYNKGSEVIRMIRTLLGDELFSRGMDLYFSRHDGMAVTVEDFLKAMEDASGRDLEQFSLWYSQSGTPDLDVKGVHDARLNRFTLTVSQSCQPTPGQDKKKPFHIPLTMGLLDRGGNDTELVMDNGRSVGTSITLELRKELETFEFMGVHERPIPVLLRGFSAPVRLEFPYEREELALIMAHEKDPFCRWEAGQKLALGVMFNLMEDRRQGRELNLDPCLIGAFRSTIEDICKDRSFVAELLTLPSERYMAEQLSEADPDEIHTVREFVRKGLTSCLKDTFIKTRENCRSHEGYTFHDGHAGDRRLANLCLSYLMTTSEPGIIEFCMDQFRSADNMTDVMGAVTPLLSCDCPERGVVLGEFYERWHNDRQVVDKWFSLQASSSLPDAISRVKSLLDHPAFELANPNRFRALVGVFSQANQVRFHDRSGDGYRFLGDQIIRLIPINPQVSATLLSPLTRWRRFTKDRQILMRRELERILILPKLPREVYEIASKSLAE